MTTIWKAELEPTELQEIEVPEGAEILSAATQGAGICVWFRCEPSAPKEKRRIAMCGTGHPCPSDGRFIGTVLLVGGTLVFHIFEKQE